MSRVLDMALFAQLLEPDEPFLHGFLHFLGGLRRRIAATKQKGKFAHCASSRVGTSHPRRLSETTPDIFSSSPGRLPRHGDHCHDQGRYSWLWVMCGRRRLGKNFLSCCSIGRVRSCVRPVLCGGEAAGHNALRGSGPNQKHAFKDALTQTGSPDPRIDLVCITSSCPRQFLQTSNAVVVSWPHLLESPWL